MQVDGSTFTTEIWRKDLEVACAHQSGMFSILFYIQLSIKLYLYTYENWDPSDEWFRTLKIFFHLTFFLLQIYFSLLFVRRILRTKHSEYFFLTKHSVSGKTLTSKTAQVSVAIPRPIIPRKRICTGTNFPRIFLNSQEFSQKNMRNFAENS